MRLSLSPIRTQAERARLIEMSQEIAQLARFIAKVADANERSEPVMISCLRQCLQDSAPILAQLQAEFGEQNASGVARWANSQYAEAAKTAGGVLVIEQPAAMAAVRGTR